MNTERAAVRLIGFAVAGLIVASCGGSATASSVGAAATAPAGWSYVSWTDPGLAVALPADWSPGDPTVTGDPSMVATLSDDQLKAQQWYDEMVAMGKVRYLANGSMPTPQGTLAGGSIDVTVETGDASLSAFADREAGVDADIGALTTAITSSSVTLTIGPAVRDAYCGKLGDSPEYCEIDELVRLADGRSLTIAISGSDVSVSIAAVASFADQVIGTLKTSP